MGPRVVETISPQTRRLTALQNYSFSVPPHLLHLLPTGVHPRTVMFLSHSCSPPDVNKSIWLLFGLFFCGWWRYTIECAIGGQMSYHLFPTLAVGLLDFKVDVALARLEADLSDQPPSIPAVPNHQVSLPCPTAEYPCSAQPPSIPAVPDHQVSLQCPTAEYPCSAQPLSIFTLPNRKLSLQCSTTKYPRSDQPQSIPAVPNCRVSLQCPATKYPCRAQPKSIPTVPNRRVSLQCPTAEYQYSCSAFAVLQGRLLMGGRETLHFLCNSGFRVGMLEVNNF